TMGTPWYPALPPRSWRSKAALPARSVVRRPHSSVWQVGCGQLLAQVEPFPQFLDEERALDRVWNFRDRFDDRADGRRHRSRIAKRTLLLEDLCFRLDKTL